MVKIMICEEHFIQEEHSYKLIRSRNNKQSVLKLEIADFVASITRMVDTQGKSIAAAATSLNLKLQL